MTEVHSCYKIFAKCFYYPDQVLAEMLVAGDLTAFLARPRPARTGRLGTLATWLTGFETTSRLLEMLQVEYTRLFVTAFPHLLAPPYASFFLENELYGLAAGELGELYTRHGFKIRDALKEPADHLAVQLEFLYRTAENHDPGVVEAGFIRDDLYNWLELLQNRIEAHASLPFYPAVLAGLRTFLAQRLKESTQIFTGVAQ